MATAFDETRVAQRSALVVDDSKIACNVLAGALIKLGYDVDVAHSAESALKLLAGPLPDVVFMDHLLPGMDGLDAVGRLRGQPRTARLPIVMYTSQESDEFAARAREAGADDIYPKSADHSLLSAILTRLDLVPDHAPPLQATPRVVQLQSDPASQPPPRHKTRRLTGADLVHLLEPSLAAHHAELHQDLLAEFTILERYEERMRRDLFARVNSLANQATQRVDRAFANRRRELEYERRGRTRRWWALAATIVMAMGLSFVTSWSVAKRNYELESQGAAMLAILDAQSEAIADLDAGIQETRSAFAREVRMAEREVPPAASETANAQQRTSFTAAAALVAEFQSMGILGPVRIETSAGSFCVRSTSNGYQFEVSNLALRDCETLPLRLAAATW